MFKASLASILLLVVLTACTISSGTFTKQVRVGGHTYNCTYRKDYHPNPGDLSNGYFTDTLISGGALC